MAAEKEEGLESAKNLAAKITNASGKKLHFFCCCKGTDDNPSGLGEDGEPIDKGHLTHGELSDYDATIDENGRGTFFAKSKGREIMGTVHYAFEGSKTDYWVYFRVSGLDKHHKESPGVGYHATDEKSWHPYVAYTFTAL